jgi:hypothetical protein
MALAFDITGERPHRTRLETARPRGVLLHPRRVPGRWLAEQSLRRLGISDHQPRLTASGVIAEIGDALGLVFPDTPVRRWAAGENCTVIRLSHPALPFAFRSTGLAESTLGGSGLCPGKTNSPERIHNACSGASSIRTVVGASIAFGRSCPADGKRSTSIPVTSSRISPPTSGRSSAITATCSGSDGPNPTPGTSRSQTEGASRCSTTSSVPRPDRPHPPTSRPIHCTRKGSLISTKPPSRVISSSRSRACRAFCTVDGPGSANRRR